MALSKLMLELKKSKDVTKSFLTYLKEKEVSPEKFLLRKSFDQIGIVILFIADNYNINIVCDKFSIVLLYLDYTKGDARNFVKKYGKISIASNFLHSNSENTLLENYIIGVRQAIEHISTPF